MVLITHGTAPQRRRRDGRRRLQCIYRRKRQASGFAGNVFSKDREERGGIVLMTHYMAYTTERKKHGKKRVSLSHYVEYKYSIEDDGLSMGHA